MDTLLVSKQEAARLLGLSLRGLEHLISRNEIPTRRIGRRVLIARCALESFARIENPCMCCEGELFASRGKIAADHVEDAADRARLRADLQWANREAGGNR